MPFLTKLRAGKYMYRFSADRPFVLAQQRTATRTILQPKTSAENGRVTTGKSIEKEQRMTGHSPIKQSPELLTDQLAHSNRLPHSRNGTSPKIVDTVYCICHSAAQYVQ
jgi:hypothetical protein